MKTIIMFAAAVTAVASTPAYAAGEGFAELRGGYAWVGDLADTESLGLALGYDFDLGSNAFIGVEANAYTDADFSDPVIGTNARLGFKPSEKNKMFATVGYAYDTWSETDDMVLGAGFEHKLDKLSLSIQYQRSLDWEINHVFVGIGTKF